MRHRLPILATLVGGLAAAMAWVVAPAALRLVRPAPASWPAAAALVRLGANARLSSRNAADFESGNIGRAQRTGPYAYALELRSDNDDALPKYWRQWFYLRLDGVPTDRPVTLTLTGAGQWSYYVPFFSYDNDHWQQFDSGAVKQPSRFTLTMTRRFAKPTVWLARYVPYTYTTLQAFLAKLRRRPDVLVTDIGLTPQGRPVPLVTITDGRETSKKTRVVIHARTHPGEVGSSFLLEGLLEFLASEAPLARRLRANLVFTVLPMLNIDGVVAGNNRVSPQGVNLEGKWYPTGDDPLILDVQRAPPEVRLFHDRLLALLRHGAPVTMALNLHASAGEPRDNVFIFPHFGPASRGYEPDEARLYAKQRAFIGDLASVQGKEWFNTPPADGTRAFLAKAVPETWWWRNFRAQVTALTIESTYGLAGRTGRWVKPADMRALGVSLAKAIARFHGLAGAAAH